MFSRRSALRLRLLRTGILMGAVGICLGATLHPNFLDTPTKDWREGPVRYFLTKQEDKLFKRLRTEKDRKGFIYRFWLIRDPTPGTPANEFKEQFRRRVLDADRLFGETTKPGWKTDMGKVYILLGPPDSSARDLMARTHRGVVIWTYQRLPHTTLGPNVVIAFAKNPKGEFVLSSAPTLDSEVAGQVRLLSPDPNLGMSRADYIRRFGRDPLLLNAGAPLGQTEMDVLMNLAEIQKLPEPEAVLDQLVTTETYFDAIPFQTRMNFFQAEDGSTFTTITVGVGSTAVFYRVIHGKDQPDVRVFARLLRDDGQEVAYDLTSEGTFLPSTTNNPASIDDPLIFQAARDLEPGRYLFLVGLEDRASSRMGTFQKWLDVPDLASGELRLSSLTLAQQLKPLEDPPPPGPRAPYILGTFRVVPKPMPDFQRSELFQIYYQIYGVEPDPVTGHPDLEITYTFHQKKGDDYIFFGSQTLPHATSAAQGYSIPLEEWPAGRYRLEVGVKNLISGETALKLVEFQIR